VLKEFAAANDVCGLRLMFRRFSVAVATSREGRREWLSVRYATLNRDIAMSPKNLAVRGLGRRATALRRGLPPPHGKRTIRVAPMTVISPNVIEIKLDRLIDEMRFIKSQMIAFDRRLKGIEAYLKPSEPNEQQPKGKSRPWYGAAARATARTVFVLFAVGAATGALLHYLGT
jgi:hypothetical protein